jgi:hypothetical protein
MLDQLRNSPEDRQIVEAASKYLKGVKGHLVQNKKNARKQAEAKAKGLQYPSLLPIGSMAQTHADQDQAAQVGNSGPSMYSQLEAVRSSVKYPTYPNFDQSSSNVNGKAPEREEDVEEGLMEAFGV